MTPQQLDELLAEAARIVGRSGTGGAAQEGAAVQLAIHIEGALGVVIPDRMLDAAHLCTPAALAATLRELEVG